VLPSPSVGRSVGRSGRAVGRAVGGSVRRAFGRLVNRSVGRLVGRAVGRAVGWSVGRAPRRAGGRAVGWSVGQSGGRSAVRSGRRDSQCAKLLWVVHLKQTETLTQNSPRSDSDTGEFELMFGFLLKSAGFYVFKKTGATQTILSMSSYSEGEDMRACTCSMNFLVELRCPMAKVHDLKTPPH
jgi:hypothetical protein